MGICSSKKKGGNFNDNQNNQDPAKASDPPNQKSSPSGKDDGKDAPRDTQKNGSQMKGDESGKNKDNGKKEAGAAPSSPLKKAKTKLPTLSNTQNLKNVDNENMKNEKTLVALLTHQDLEKSREEFFNQIKKLGADDRRIVEIVIVASLSLEYTKFYYFIELDWANEYLNYLKGQNPKPANKMEHENLSQGLINDGQQLAKVNQFIWAFLSRLYDGHACPVSDNKDGSNVPYYSRSIDGKPNTKSFLACPPWILKSIKQQQSGTKRRSEERELITSNMQGETQLYYIIEQNWWEEYQKYLRANNTIQNPGPVVVPDIDLILDARTFKKDAYPINEVLWQIISFFYRPTGEPVIVKKFANHELEEIIQMNYSTWFTSMVDIDKLYESTLNIKEKIKQFNENVAKSLSSNYSEMIKNALANIGGHPA